MPLGDVVLETGQFQVFTHKFFMQWCPLTFLHSKKCTSFRLLYNHEQIDLTVRDTNWHAETNWWLHNDQDSITNDQLEACNKWGDKFGFQIDNVDANNSETHYKNPFHWRSFPRNLYFSWTVSLNTYKLIVTLQHFMGSIVQNHYYWKCYLKISQLSTYLLREWEDLSFKLTYILMKASKFGVTVNDIKSYELCMTQTGYLKVYCVHRSWKLCQNNNLWPWQFEQFKNCLCKWKITVIPYISHHSKKNEYPCLYVVIMQHGWKWLERPKLTIPLLGKVDRKVTVSHIL